MNHYVELLLGASIIVLLMNVPEFLQEMAASSLGKMLLLSIVVFTLCYCGKNAGILAALVYIIVVYKTNKESFKLFEGLGASASIGSGGISLNLGTAGKKEKKEEEEEEEFSKKKKEGLAPNSDETCKAADSEKPYFNDGSRTCQKTEPFSLQEIEKLKKMATKEGFSNFNRHRNLQTHAYKLSHQNTTDNDRDVKVKAEKAKVAASKEMGDEKNQSN
jgi:hypothetical protein